MNEKIEETNEALFIREEKKSILDDPIIVPADKFYLDDILTKEHFDELFSRDNRGKIFVLNKNRCGNGGTTGFIRYAEEHSKGLIVSVPNRSIVFSKARENKKLEGIVGGVKNPDLNKTVRVATWDKTEYVANTPQYGFGYTIIDMNDLESWNPSFWSGSLLLVDEYHKLVEDNDYREICGKMTKTIIDANECVVLMSATPNDEYIEFLKQYKEVVSIDIMYDDECNHHDHHILQWYDRPKGIESYNIFNHLWENVRTKGVSKQMVVFYSSVDAIKSFIENLPDDLEEDVEVLCSSKHKDMLPWYSDVFNPNKSLHFLTSANFTGMDIYQHIDVVMIVGGDSGSNMAYSWREVKQILGRFRRKYDNEGYQISGGYDGVYILKDGRKYDDTGYINSGKAENRYKFRVSDVNDEKKREMQYIEDYMSFLYYSCEEKRREGWSDSKSFADMMSVYREYNIKAYPLPKVREYKKKRDIPYKEFKKKRMSGVKIKHRMSAMAEYYIEKKGMDAFEKATKHDIERFYNINTKVGDTILESLSANEMYDLLLGDRYYRGSYLMGVLAYLGKAPKTDDGKLDYRMLEITMNKVFGCMCVYMSGDKKHPSACWFLCVMVDYTKSRRHTLFRRKRWQVLYTKTCPEFFENPYEEIRISRNRRPVGQTSVTSTEYLLDMKLPSVINGGEKAIYERTVREGSDHFAHVCMQKDIMTALLDDPSKIAGFRADPVRNEAFDYYKNYHQSLVSEFYDDTGKVGHRFKTEEMSKIDCLIVDIDGGIRYNEFAELYKDYEWIALPTISNGDKDNWTKFRVIYPLSQTLEIPNESLKVLKTLRSMICPFEDRNHQLGSYLNEEQWGMRRQNTGELFDIQQDIVVYLDTRIKNLKFHNGKIKRGKTDGSYEITEWWSIEDAIAYYYKHDIDDKRHHAAFIIKNNLSEEDCVAFEDWLVENSTQRYIDKHWKTHKKLSYRAGEGYTEAID